MKLNVDIKLNELAVAILNDPEITQEDVFNFIVRLDHEIEDWDFTKKLYNWLKEEAKIYKEQMGEEM